MIKEKISILWLKRDLRSHDHMCLSLCSKLSLADPEFKVLTLYTEEMGYWESNKSSKEQREFVHQCVLNLNHNLLALNKRSTMDDQVENKHENIMVFVPTEFTNALEPIIKLKNYYDIENIFCHRETGNGWTFTRDIQMKRFCKSSSINFIELKSDCLARGKREHNDFQSVRKNFSNSYYKFYTTAQEKAPVYIRKPKHVPDWLVTQTQSYLCKEPNGGSTTNKLVQLGGEDIAISSLNEFLKYRCLTGKGYRSEMSNPMIGSIACSRISAHLSWGCLSQKLAFQQASKVLKEFEKEERNTKGKQTTFKSNQIQSFLTRLAWRSHFMQKFESLDWMEFKCINPQAENLRTWDQELFERWRSGQTGYPFIDACMRSLNQTKWLNFRARALVVSFASYALNLDWRGFGPHLATNFLDYEPGIHYSQLQMQSGTTLGSTTRIYSPVKQSVEKDPTGDFIRKWVPELRDIKTSLIHIPNYEPRKGYPPAIIPLDRLWGVMRGNTIQNNSRVNRAQGSHRTLRSSKTNKTSSKNSMEVQQELILA